MTAAAAAPLYLNAADQSIVSNVLRPLPPSRIGITLTETPGGTGNAGIVLLAAAAGVPGGSGAAASDRFGPPILTTDLLTKVYSPVGGLNDSLDLVARTGACADLRLVSGRCAGSIDEVMLSTRSAEQLRVQVGSTFPLSGTKASVSFSPGTASGPSRRSKPIRLVVSGIYQPGDPAAAVWWGQNFFEFGSAPPGGSEPLDSGFVTAAAAAKLSAEIEGSSFVQLPLHPATISAADVPHLLGVLSRWEVQVRAADGATVGSFLPTVLATAEGEESSARIVTLVVALQLVLLALLVLYNVARATSALRAGDVRVAELRGLPRRRIVMLALREPVVLLVVAVPIGIGLAWVVVAAVGKALLGFGAPALDSLALAAAGVAFAGGVLSAAFGSRALLRLRLGEESLDAGRRRRAFNAGILDALGLALAASGLAELVSKGSRQATGEDLLALLGPGLIALGLGILGARLLPLAANAMARATRWSRRVAVALASRSISRRDVVARRVIVPTIAAGLLAFSVAGLAVSRRNDSMQATFTVGAPVVLHVQVRPGVNFLAAVRSAAPGPGEAMAVAVVRQSFGETLAVDSSRLAGIAAWPADLASRPLRVIAAALRPPTPPARTIPPGDRLVLTADLGGPLNPEPDLELTVFDEQPGVETSVDFGHLRPGAHQYSGALLGSCNEGCRMDAFTLLWPAGNHPDRRARAVSLRLSSLAIVTGKVSRVLPVGFSHAGWWEGSGPMLAQASTGGLTVAGDLLVATSPPTISPVDVPATLPIVVTSTFAALNASATTPGQYAAIGLDGNQVASTGVGTVGALPRIGDNASMIDLGLAQLVQTAPVAGASYEIWCHAPPSAALIDRLDRLGVTIVGSESVTPVLKGLERTGASLGFDLFGASALGALVLALGALMFAAAASARQIGVEFAGLAAVGVPRRTLRRSVVIEALMISGTGAALGWLAGVAGASLALRILPEFPPGRVGPPLETALPWAALAIAGAAVCVALAGAAIVSAAVVMRQVRPDRLRMSQ